MESILTKHQEEVLEDVCSGIVTLFVGPGQTSPHRAAVVEQLKRLFVVQIVEIRKLREIAKHAGAHARGDEDGAKLSELLDATQDPELMFTR
jgi:hypothetical protein